MDVLTKAQRSLCMSRIRGKDTKPEMVVRRLVHGLGFRFRLHSRALPSRPDLVLARLATVVLVHGCFWHMHRCRFGRVVPATRTDFWQAKRRGNVARDVRSEQALRRLGWRVIVVWECETRVPERLLARLNRRLTSADLRSS